MVRLSPTVINRAMLMDEALREYGSKVFYYSPKHIRAADTDIPGYVIENHQFVPASMPVPSINGNWTYSTRRLLDKGMGYRNFVEWAENQGVGIYVPLTFSELAVNKYEVYKAVRCYRQDIHPHTERYRQSREQLGFFLQRSSLVFLKPRAGNKGDGILTVRQGADGFTVTCHRKGKRKQYLGRTLADAHRFIKAATGGTRRYIIQHGIQTMPYQGATFDLRVVMLHDGSQWSWLHEARVSRRGAELSNISQGGTSLVTEDLLLALFGAEDAAEHLQALRDESFGLAGYFDRLHPGEIMEVAFDFVLDTQGVLHLVEINSKPGLVSVGFEVSFLHKQPEHEALFERWVYPHVRSLASFLHSKVEAA